VNKVRTGKVGIAEDPDHKAQVRYSFSRFRNYTHSEPRFRALLTEGGAQRVELAGA
jgi:hypothetical protein